MQKELDRCRNASRAAFQARGKQVDARHFLGNPPCENLGTKMAGQLVRGGQWIERLYQNYDPFGNTFCKENR